MTSNTIDNDRTMSGSEGTLLANRYRIIRQLGQGGMGSVWLAEDMQLDNKRFAIKMLPSILVSNKRAYAQLKSEALVAMKLVHPNIVQIRAFEENNGNPFLVMDYVDGRTLDDYLVEKGKLGENETIRLLRPVAAALDYAHSRGVVHRDVKPGNIMLSKDGASYILDFGISREMQETMTRVTGKFSSGTLLYMSPEQLNGAQPRLEQDVYSFAVVVYECLKGEPPFCRGQVDRQILENNPEPLPDSVADLRFAASIMSGLSKDPVNRPRSCIGLLLGRSAATRAEGTSQVGAGAGTGDTRRRTAIKIAESKRPLAAGASVKQRKISAIALAAALVMAVAGVAGYSAWSAYDRHVKSVRAAEEEVKRKNAEEERKRAVALRQKAEMEAVYAKASGRRDVVAGINKADGFERLTREFDRLFGEADAFRKAQQEMVKARTAAMDQWNKVMTIPDGNGFRQRKQALQSAIDVAQQSADGEKWDEAKQKYLSLKNDAEALLGLDAERKSALASRNAALAAFGGAKKSGAENFPSTARELERVTNGDWKTAESLMKNMDFRRAKEKFGDACNHYLTCGDNASDLQKNEELKKIRHAGQGSKQESSANITIIVDGKPLNGEEVKIGDRVYKTPIRWRFDGSEVDQESLSQVQNIEKRMKAMKLPACSFRPPATLVDAVDYFRQASKDFDLPHVPAEERGINIALRLKSALTDDGQTANADAGNASASSASSDNKAASAAGPVPQIPRITASSISLWHALDMVCLVTGYKFQIRGPFVVVMPEDEKIDDSGVDQVSRFLAQNIEKRMKGMKLPAVSFRPPATLVDAVDYFRQASKDFDLPDVPTEERGMNIVLRLKSALTDDGQTVNAGAGNASASSASSDNKAASAAGPVPQIPGITASNISLWHALDMVCLVTGYKFQIRGPFVVVMPKDMAINPPVSRSHNGLNQMSECSVYGGLEVTFERNGKHYFGTLEKFKVDWRGTKEFNVVMKEYTGPRHGETRTLILPGGEKAARDGEREEVKCNNAEALLAEIAAAEELRRASLDQQAEEEIAAADLAYSKRDWDEAFRLYDLALKNLNDRPATAPLREKCRERMAEAKRQAGGRVIRK